MKKALRYLVSLIVAAVMMLLPCMPVSAAGTTVSTSTSLYALETTNQHKIFVANGRIWAFYWNGSSFVYKTSADNGNTWSSETIIDADYPPTAYNSYYDVASDGTYAHFVKADDGDYDNPAMYYRRASFNSDGSLTYSSNWQLEENRYSVYSPSIAIDSNGYPWIGGWDGYLESAPTIFKSSTKNGTWTTQIGFPYWPEYGTIDYVTFAPLTSGKMGVLLYSWETGKGVKYLEWSGSSWSSVSTVYNKTIDNAATLYKNHSTAVTYGDNIVCTFEGASSEGIAYVKRISGTWSKGVVWAPLNMNTLTVDASTGDCYCFWYEKLTDPLVNHILYSKYTASAGTWSSAIDHLSDNEGGSTTRYLSSYQSMTSSNIGILYATNDTSPYNLKFVIYPTPSASNNFSYVGPLDVTHIQSIMNFLFDNYGAVFNVSLTR